MKNRERKERSSKLHPNVLKCVKQPLEREGTEKNKGKGKKKTEKNKG